MNKYNEQLFNDNLIKTEQTIEIESLDMTEEELKNIIVIQCNKGHFYKINKESPIFEEEIKMQCPFCSKRQIENKLKYSLFDNTEKLTTLIETYPKIFGFLKYLKYYKSGTEEIDITELEILDDTTIRIEKAIDNPYFTCDKKVKRLDDVLVFPEYLSIRDLIAKCFYIEGLEESIEHIYNKECYKACEKIDIDISELDYNKYYHTLFKSELIIISKKALIKYIDVENEKRRNFSFSELADIDLDDFFKIINL